MKKRSVLPVLAVLGAAAAYVSYRVKKEIDKEAIDLDEGLLEDKVNTPLSRPVLEDSETASDIHYANLSEEAVASIKQTTSDAINELAQQGDVQSVERPIQQMITFETPEDEQAFRQEVMRKAYVVSKGEAPLEVIVLHISVINEAHLFPAVLEIADLAKKYNGKYNGWKSKIVTK